MKSITIHALKCTRCQHQWLPRIAGQPKRCPNCKSPYWHKKKRKES